MTSHSEYTRSPRIYAHTCFIALCCNVDAQGAREMLETCISCITIRYIILGLYELSQADVGTILSEICLQPDFQISEWLFFLCLGDDAQPCKLL